MGFLDHSTNNIIIDAVLTDVGRSKLADNNGSFQIAFFSLGDDEVDYTIIQKFGRTVGKEKLTKNTPVFEAQTLGSNALKHRLLTLPDPTIFRMPSLSLTAGAGSDNTVTLTKGTTTSVSLTLKQTITSNLSLPDGTSDVTFTMLVPDRFLSIEGLPRLQVEPTTRIATYNRPRTGVENQNASILTFTLQLQPIDDTSFSTFGNGTTIRSLVSVIGDQSGLRHDFTVNINKSA